MRGAPFLSRRSQFVLLWFSPLCKEPITSFKIEACPSCHIIPPNDDQWQYNMSRYISFMDHTAELAHPNVPSRIITDLFGFQVRFNNLAFFFIVQALFGREKCQERSAEYERLHPPYIVIAKGIWSPINGRTGTSEGRLDFQRSYPHAPYQGKQPKSRSHGQTHFLRH